VLAAAGLIFVLAYHVDWKALPAQIGRLSGPLALFAFVSLSAQFVLGPWKWRMALEMHHLHHPLRYLIRAYGIGFFFNTFLPSGMGGDAYRVASTWPHEGRSSRAISAVLVDRGAGFAALLLIGCAAALPLIPHNRYARMFATATLCVVTALALIFRALRSGRMQRLSERLRRRRFFAAVITNFADLMQAGRRWFKVLGVALVFHACGIAAIYLLYVSVGAPAPLGTCALIAAASGLAVIVPVSVNGIGVVEAAFVGAAVALGEPYGASLAVALLMRILVLPQTAAFGLLYAMSRHTSPRSVGTSAVEAPCRE
jgi:uncharacterized protein (TIRG00374 family)